jgi:serine/threonine protein phosphatase PrpC
MIPLLNYDNSKDQEIYLNKSFSDLSIKISACTVAGKKEKPNEDAFALARNRQDLWVGVFDGTSSLKPLEKLKGKTGAWYASHFLMDSFSKIKSSFSSKEALINLNYKLLKEAKKIGGRLDDTHSLPAAVGTIIKIDMKTKQCEFAHVGDTYCIAYYKNGSSMLISNDRNQKFDDGMFKLIKKVAEEKEITNKEARQDDRVKSALIEMYIRRNNNPNGLGSGIINGDPNLEKYILADKFSLNNILAILIASDGLEIQGCVIQKASFRKLLFDKFKAGGFKEIIRLKKESEKNDPEWKNIRYKDSDDATGVMIEFV